MPKNKQNLKGKVLSLVELFEKRYPEQDLSELESVVSLLRDYKWDVMGTDLVLKLSVASKPFNRNNEEYCIALVKHFSRNSTELSENDKLDSILELCKSEIVGIDHKLLKPLITDLKHLSFS
ncbi:hypothetical protein [Reichenbachiella sp.]|uniref:hypothetical protein n=1 Tax=Reichenbachiella sp. TaxID=2184521 RepID=UPI003299A87F